MINVVNIECSLLIILLYRCEWLVCVFVVVVFAVISATCLC